MSTFATNRPFVLCIGGFDPSAGAGILADIKMAERSGCYGLAALSCNTIQCHDSFHSIIPTDLSTLQNQIKKLLETYPIGAIKIGLLPQLDWLLKILQWVNPDSSLPVVWDPVLSASAGFDFHQDYKDFTIPKGIQLITPNWEEAKSLSGMENPIPWAIALDVPVLIKGGHCDSEMVTDLLFEPNNNKVEFSDEWIKSGEKHGSGCMLSTAIACQLALGKTINEACKEAKALVRERLASNPSLLAHYF